MRYMLDTNICIYIIKMKPKKVLKKFLTFDVDEVGISTITLAELEFGVQNSSRFEQNKIALAEFILPLEISAFDEISAEEYGIIRTDLRKKGQLIGDLDMLIAAHAKSIGCVLVTNNEKEFIRVNGLTVENWI
jgi:tRNA(fMet)-specific endonuclease VapC